MCKVAIRADGSSSIGMGHVIRCLSLACELRDSGCKVYFISNYDEGIHKIKDNGFDVVNTKSQNSNTEYNLLEEAELTKKFLESINACVLIIDSYNVNYDYLYTLKQNVKSLVYIDDINSFTYPVDVLVNGNITGLYLDYKKYSTSELMLLGPEFNMIRSEFRSLPARKVNKSVNSIMVTTGGSDPYNYSPKLLEMLMSNEIIKELQINMIVGAGFTNKNLLREMASKNKNIILHEDVKSISQVMMQSDIAISSGGSTLYELCACGTPALAFVMADNQQFIVEKMHEEGYVKSLGWHEKIKADELNSAAIELMNNYKYRSTVSKNMQKLVDGMGTKRIVDCIVRKLI